MKTLTSRKALKPTSSLQKEYIRELCFRTPFLVINTPCGIGKYKFRVRSVDGDKVINVFEGDYEVKIFQTIKPFFGFSI